MQFLRFPIPLLSALAGFLLLAGCSQSAPPTQVSTAATNSAPAVVPKFPYGAKVDSLNGVAGHPFGQPPSAFAKLEVLPLPPGLPTRAYTQAAGATPGWFGRHRREVPTQLYTFLDGQFCRFRAVGDAATLRAEAQYLLGPGLAQGASQLFWEGERARAVYSEQARGFGREGTLDILSKPLEAVQAAKAQAQLKADNAQ